MIQLSKQLAWIAWQEHDYVMVHLQQEYGDKIQISWVMQRELGFTFRSGSITDPDMHHTWYRCGAHSVAMPLYNTKKRLSPFCIGYFVDFVNEKAATWFALKYARRD